MRKSNPAVPAKMVKLHKVSMDCIKHLVIVKGYTPDQAESMVLTVLKESQEYLKKGMVNETIATLKMTFMDQSVEQASSELIKSLLK
jgi:hypothetical protein